MDGDGIEILGGVGIGGDVRVRFVLAGAYERWCRNGVG